MTRLRFARGGLLVTVLLGGISHLGQASATKVPAQSLVTVTVDPGAPGATVSADFVGLSFEMERLLPDALGNHYFSPANRRLAATFRVLGVKSLRVGGNTADRPSVRVPGTADVDRLFAFARAANVRVIYTLRLRGGNGDAAAATAKYIVDRYGSNLECFVIGNEPDIFTRAYPAYRAEWEQYVAAITTPSMAPAARFCGPSVTQARVAWARDFANDFGTSRHLAMITQHDYPGESARAVTNQRLARSWMLSAEWTNKYEKLHAAFVPSVASNRLPYRLEEANSFYNGGAKDVSDTFTAALWALDYMYWWASHGAKGINFHTGDTVAAGEENTPCRYAVFWTSPQGYSVHPVGYGLKAFDLGSHGRLVPATFTSKADPLNLTGYGILGPDKTLYVTLINKEHGAKAYDAHVTIAPGESYAAGHVMFLKGTSGDISVTSGVTLGGAEIKDDAGWEGTWTALGSPSRGRRFTVMLPAATAAVVKLTAR